MFDPERSDIEVLRSSKAFDPAFLLVYRITSAVSPCSTFSLERQLYCVMYGFLTGRVKGAGLQPAPSSAISSKPIDTFQGFRSPSASDS